MSGMIIFAIRVFVNVEVIILVRVVVVVLANIGVPIRLDVIRVLARPIVGQGGWSA